MIPLIIAAVMIAAAVLINSIVKSLFHQGKNEAAAGLSVMSSLILGVVAIYGCIATNSGVPLLGVWTLALGIGVELLTYTNKGDK